MRLCRILCGMITLKAYAKINLGLRILRQRDDGYHDIETIFHRVNIYDEIVLTPSQTTLLRCDNSEVPTDEKNLCIRAAHVLQHYTKTAQGVHIELKKNIPIGAGLGGGSADAAATLLGLANLWRLSLSEHELHSIALQLGSDVPYFLRQGTASATGRGEILDYFDCSIPYWIVVIYPLVHISTAWAYKNFKSQPSTFKPQTSLKNFLLENIYHPSRLTNFLLNDFESLVFQTYPQVVQAKEILSQSGALFIQLSGSGSSVYGFFETKESAERVMRMIPRGYKVFFTEPHFKPE